MLEWKTHPSIHPSPVSSAQWFLCEANHKVDSWNYNWTFELLRMDYSLSKSTQLFARTNTDVDNKHTAIRCLDSALGIDRVWSILLLPRTSRTAATAGGTDGNLDRYQKRLVWQQSVSKVYLRGLPELSTVLLVTHSYLAEAFFLFFLHLLLFLNMLFHHCVSLLQPLPKATSIKAVKAPQPIDSLIEYHNYQQLACTMTSVKNH